jgi:hypothetical protein
MQYSNQIIAMIKSNRSQTILQHSLGLNPTAHGKKKRERESTQKEIVGMLRRASLPSVTLEPTTPLWHHQEDCEQLMGEPMTIRIPRPSGFGSKGLPSRRSSGQCCT